MAVSVASVAGGGMDGVLSTDCEEGCSVMMSVLWNECDEGVVAEGEQCGAHGGELEHVGTGRGSAAGGEQACTCVCKRRAADVEDSKDHFGETGAHCEKTGTSGAEQSGVALSLYAKRKFLPSCVDLTVRDAEVSEASDDEFFLVPGEDSEDFPPGLASGAATTVPSPNFSATVTSSEQCRLSETRAAVERSPESAVSHVEETESKSGCDSGHGTFPEVRWTAPPSKPSQPVANRVRESIANAREDARKCQLSASEDDGCVCRQNAALELSNMCRTVSGAEEVLDAGLACIIVECGSCNTGCETIRYCIMALCRCVSHASVGVTILDRYCGLLKALCDIANAPRPTVWRQAARAVSLLAKHPIETVGVEQIVECVQIMYKLFERADSSDIRLEVLWGISVFCKSDAKRSCVLLEFVDPSELLMKVEQQNVPGLSNSIMDILAVSTREILARVQESGVNGGKGAVKHLLPRLSCKSVEESVHRLMQAPGVSSRARDLGSLVIAAIEELRKVFVEA